MGQDGDPQIVVKFPFQPAKEQRSVCARPNNRLEIPIVSKIPGRLLPNTSVSRFWK